jgi:hypothetical protein
MLRAFFLVLIGCVRSRRDLVLENLALRQHLGARHPRPRLALHDRLFWVILRRFWSDWRRALLIVHPETVVRWHRAGFKMYWKWISRRRMDVCDSGRKPTPKALRQLIFRMVAENTWGAPRIHGELKMLGYKISERTVLRWMQKAPRNPKPARHWAGAEISQGLLGARDRTLGVNDPVVAEESAQPCSKRTGLSQVQEAAVEVEIICIKGYDNPTISPLYDLRCAPHRSR